MKEKYSHGKHLNKYQDNKKNKNKIVLFIVVSLVVFVISIVIFLSIIENGSTINNDSVITQETTEELKNEIDKAEIVDVNMPEKIENYYVIGKLIIEKINFDQYILNKTNNDSLNLSVTKFYGPKVNEKGNLCITGHNSKKFFRELKKLEVNDTFYIIDKEESKKITYKIYDKYSIYPNNLDCLNQDTNDKREVTLITCNARWAN